MKPETLKIGLPTNSRLNEDLKPFITSLALEGRNGRMKASGLANAEFRMLRVQDIATFLRRGILDLGIVGLDVMVEEVLSDGKNNKRSEGSVEDFRDDKGDIVNAFSIDAGEVTKMTLLMSEGEREATEDWSRLSDPAVYSRKVPYDNPQINIVTSYPKIARASIARNLQDYFSPTCPKNDVPFRIAWVFIQEVAGKVEEIVTNRDFPGQSFGLDIVKSGKTAKECGLVAFGEPVLESRPGLYAFEREGRRFKNQIQDGIAFLREKLMVAQVPITNGLGQNFVESGLKNWEYAKLAEK